MRQSAGLSSGMDGGTQIFRFELDRLIGRCNINIEQALTDIANRYQFDPQQLVSYSYEDTVGGWDGGQGRWPLGSIWSVEGRVLYALTRALKPEFVIEIGVYHGCSTTHFARALRANGTGTIIGIDPNAHEIQLGDAIPSDLWDIIELVSADGPTWIENEMPEGMLTLLFEDADHASETTRRVWRAAAAKLAPGSIIVSHDATHFLVGADVRRGILESGVQNFWISPLEPSDCGLGLVRLPMPTVAPLTVSAKLEKAAEEGERAAVVIRKRGRPKKEKATA